MKINFVVFFFSSFSNLDTCDIKNYFICVSVFRSEFNFGCLFLGLIHLFLEYQVSQWKPLSSLDWLAGESQQSRTRIQLSSPYHHIRDPGPDSTYLPHTTTPGIHAWDPPIQHILTLQRSRPRFYLSTTPGILAQILHIHHTPLHQGSTPGIHLSNTHQSTKMHFQDQTYFLVFAYFPIYATSMHSFLVIMKMGVTLVSQTWSLIMFLEFLKLVS